MRKSILFTFLEVALLILAGGLVYSEEIEVEEDYEYGKVVSTLTRISPPVVTRDYIIFTYETGHRFVGIAFDFEKYSKIHPYQNRVNYDFDGNVTSSVMFFILERPAELVKIKYRMIIDGLWLADKNNPLSEYDSGNGITVSFVDIGEKIPETTNSRAGTSTRFIYRGEAGKRVRIAGNFTNWDSWIYELEEKSPGFYVLDLPLPRGEYYYNYYIGVEPVIDRTNPKRAYGNNGEEYSMISVE